MKIAFKIFAAILIIATPFFFLCAPTDVDGVKVMNIPCMLEGICCAILGGAFLIAGELHPESADTEVSHVNKPEQRSDNQIYVEKGSKRIPIYPSELDDYLNDGWTEIVSRVK